MRLASLLLALSVAGCITSPPADRPQPDGPPPSATTAAPAATTAASVVGRWSSPSCGKRAYPRLLTFTAAGTFMAEDRVAPCPPGTQCIWAGIVFHKGQYSLSSGAITLTPDGARDTRGEPLPTNMSIDPSGAPVETGSDGKPCIYAAAQP
jgi:hypothetical protein